MWIKKISVLFSLFLFSSLIFSQTHGGRANWWFFGDSLSMNFNGLVPNQVNNSSLRGVNSVISMSNKQGNLLYYGNHRFIYNSNHQVMQNGILFNYTTPPSSPLDFLDGNMAVLTLPSPCNNNIYYHFYVSSNNNHTTSPCLNCLLYSVIDMSLDNGLGGIIATQKNIFVDDSLYHFITATKHANNRDYWIMTRKRGTNQWKAWLLTPTGISPTPIISTIGQLPHSTLNSSGVYGQVKFSHRGNKMAMTNNLSGGSQCGFYYNPVLACSNLNNFELYDFDRTTGLLSNSLPLDFDSSFFDFSFPLGHTRHLFSIEFSPNDSILYAVTGHVVVQYDLSSNNPAVIPSAWNLLFRAPPALIYNVHAQMGSDKKIYIANGVK
jgi:hypothetical protein